MGLKGCTAYRPNPVTGAVLSSGTAEKGQVQEKEDENKLIEAIEKMIEGLAG